MNVSTKKSLFFERNEEQAYLKIKIKIRFVWKGARSTPMGAARKFEIAPESMAIVSEIHYNIPF